MSGKPSIEGIEKFRKALSALSEAGANMQRLDQQIVSLRRDHEMWTAAAKAAHELVFQLLDQMDLTASGNYGHWERMQWFLVELHRQYTRSPAIAVPEEPKT